MKFKQSLLGSVVTASLAATISTSPVHAYEVTVDKSLFSSSGTVQAKASATGTYIIQLKGKPGIARAEELGELVPSNQLVAVAGNNYNAQSAAMQAYTNQLRAKQDSIASDIGQVDILRNYVHAFNGFSAKLTPQQAQNLKNHPDVQLVWEDEKFKPNTVNTPEFLGLTGPGGQHSLDIKGEDVIVGILDTGIAPENDSFADDGSYSDPAALGWTGTCDAGEEAEAGTFNCNNKLIGARYFKDSFESVYPIQYALGEFESPRDADGHGSHTASTAAGNEGVTASLNGAPVGTMSGIAPRARVAAYKVCWNSDYVTPEGEDQAGCFFGDSMAAIDQAVADGVDVLNYSIGNGVSLDNPVYAASVQAAAAGVFFAASAGNSGPTAATTRNGAPWMATVAASTYDGVSYVNGLEITNRDPLETIGFTEGAITAPLVETGDKSGTVVIADPLLACHEGESATPLDNAADIAGNIALISRGACAFDEKVARAQLSGAEAVIIYSNSGSVTRLGGNLSFDIPGGMISQVDGQAMNAAITGGEAVTVRMSASVFAEQVEVGNLMAGFSSRGENQSSNDIIKPDITAPGVRILAAQTDTPMFGPQGATAGYLSGTSMSGPHIAGMAALLRGQYPDWSPAQIKSALMTTARQNVLKEDAATPADPFDFGAGHAAPVAAMDPGLTFDTNFGDYMGFMCGLDEEGFVLAQSGANCGDIESFGFATDPSQLNYPSIAIGELGAAETISRTVADVSGLGGTYVATIEAPAGIDVTLRTFDGAGVETPGSDLVVAADGSASFALTFEKNETAVINQWTFGAITFTNEHGHSVRSPIAINPAPDVDIVVPESLSLQLNRGRTSFPVEMLYSGATSLDYAGLTAPFGITGAAPMDPDSSFDFVEGLDTAHFLTIPAGTKVVRYSLRDSMTDVPGADLDIYVYRCTGFSCVPVESSLNGGSNEDVIMVNPEPRDDSANGDLYIVFVHAWSTNGAEQVNYTMPTWYAIGAENGTRISGSRRAVDGRFNFIRVSARDLDPSFLYMGGVTFYNAEGVAQGTTVLEVQP